MSSVIDQNEQNAEDMQGHASVLDAEIVADYITAIGRDHGVSNEQCFYGRAALPRA